MSRKPYRLLQDEDRTRAWHLRERYEKTPRSRDAKSGGERARLLDKRTEIKKAISDLAWFAREWPEPELKQVFTPETIRPLLDALVNSSKKSDVEREYQIALTMTKLGVDKCLQAMGRLYTRPGSRTRELNPFYQETMREANGLLELLRFAVNSKWLAKDPSSS